MVAAIVQRVKVINRTVGWLCSWDFVFMLAILELINDSCLTASDVREA